MRKLRAYFLTGLIVILPTVISVYVLYKIFLALDGILADFLTKYIGFRIPGAGIVTLVLLIILAGMFARNFFGRGLLRFWDRIIGKIPLISKVYNALKRISEAFFMERSSGFRKVVLVEYPRKGVYSMAFMTAAAAGEVQNKTGAKMVSVFLPTTPNPTSGFFLLYPEDQVIPLTIPVDEALRMIVSAGLAPPDEREPFVVEGRRESDET
jgi:uncharacterized membrane protein